MDQAGKHPHCFLGRSKNGTDSDRFLLGDWTGSANAGSYDFHSNGANMFWSSGKAKNAATRQNGTAISDTTAVPVSPNMSILSLKANEDLIASNFSNDRNHGAEPGRRSRRINSV